ncbi:helix-turn-helix domain-containing protein [Limnobaculum xujianqingii]|uniref:helix-turn-helix domain-containing protein n=1 Tax=Limnobaculum xujianqingii TaxID=2738837 RepID=UPI0011286F65|nr:helix-turn-helix domain-containing protein [Limnobaculum xujianqingii]
MKEAKSSAEKVLDVLNVLLKNFAIGFTNGELARATGLSAPNITRYVAILESAGFAERIPETDRIRPSHSLAKHAVAILTSMDEAKQRLDSSILRITKG